MKIIFTKNKSIFSSFLRWGLKEPVSHMAIVFDDRIVFHSNFKGIHIEWFETFKKKNEIVYEINIKLPLVREEYIYQNVISKYDGYGYDFEGLLYLTYRVFLNKLFGIRLPKENKWASESRFFCIELVHLFEELKIEENVEVLTPYGVYLKLKDKYGK